MQTLKTLQSLLLLAAFVTVATTCRKIDFKDPAQRCKIVETSDRFFTYDAFDNPIACTYKENPDWIGNPTFNFHYDAQHRLIAYSAFSEHRLTYNSNGQAIIDSIVQNYAGQDLRYAERLYYDIFGRITRTVTELYHAEGVDLPPPHSEETTHYRYDKRGNLVVKGFDDDLNEIELPYDHKTSLLRTNPIYMLIHRNYSINNLKTTTGYNSAGLPDTYNGTFLEGRGSERQITYDCEQKNGG